jgi:hypothetical protein
LSAKRSAYVKAFCDAGEKSVGANIFLIAISGRSIAGLVTEVRNLAGLVASVCVFIACTLLALQTMRSPLVVKACAFLAARSALNNCAV